MNKINVENIGIIKEFKKKYSQKEFFSFHPRLVQI